MAKDLKMVSECQWVMPKSGGMKVDGIIFATREIIDDLEGTKAIEQVRNVAHLPGILQASLAMPDIHEGYGFPIGGVAATDVDSGVISPGGIGYDINCGVRIMVSNLTKEDVMKRQEELVNNLFANIPTGVGKKGSISAILALTSVAVAMALAVEVSCTAIATAGLPSSRDSKA